MSRLLAEHMAMTGTLSKPRHSSNDKTRGITDLDTWLKAWCVYASVLTAATPQLVPDLFRYLNYIVLASCRFKPYAWLQYDTQFRLKMASDLTISWSLQYSTIDDAIKICYEVGPGALLAEVDLKMLTSKMRFAFAR